MKNKSILAFSEHHDPDADDKINISKIYCSTKTEKLEKTLKKEFKSTIRKKYELEKRKNVRTESSSLAFSHYRDSNAKNEPNQFLAPKFLCDYEIVDRDLDV